MLYHLQDAMRLIYEKGLRNIDPALNGEILRRFVDFYIETVKMVKSKDEYQRKHTRPRPRDRLCWSLNVMYLRERCDYEMPSVISFGDNKIDLVKWEAGGKDEIIAAILSKRKAAKGASRPRSDEVKIDVDEVD